MNMKKSLITLSVLCSLLLLSPARAATVQYELDQSNKLSNEEAYVLVSISDDTEGQIDFHVETLPALADQAHRNYGIQAFGFGFGELFPQDLSKDDFVLPERWRVQNSKRMSKAGRFDVRIKGNGRSRQDPLEFSIVDSGLGLEDIAAGFAAHVAGFKRVDDNVKSGFVYGDTPVSPVPLPAAVWLFGSGLLGLVGVARRRIT